MSQEDESREDQDQESKEVVGIKVPSQCKKPKSSLEKEESLARTATLTDDCCEEGTAENAAGETME